MSISVYIITFNEKEKISDCIKSVLWADEIIVADSNSTDCLLYTSPSPRDGLLSRMPSSA